MRGINDTVKREEVVDIFKKGKFELLVLMEMKLKGKGEVSCSGFNDIISGVQEMERAVLLNDVWHSAGVKSGYVSSRIFWMEFKFSRVKVCVVEGYSPSIGDGTTWTGIWIV